MGFTLRAALGALDDSARDRGRRARSPRSCNGRRGRWRRFSPVRCDDPRVRLELADVAELIRRGRRRLRRDPARRRQRPRGIDPRWPTTGSTTRAASPPPAPRSSPAACWRCGRGARPANSRKGCATPASRRRKSPRARAAPAAARGTSIWIATRPADVRQGAPPRSCGAARLDDGANRLYIWLRRRRGAGNRRKGGRCGVQQSEAFDRRRGGAGASAIAWRAR